jgi:hypothetical protein
LAQAPGRGGVWLQGGGGELNTTVKMVDPARGVAVVAIMADNGIRLREVKIPPNVKFETKDGKKMADGLKNPMFQNRENRFSIPVTIKYAPGGAAIDKITLR